MPRVLTTERQLEELCKRLSGLDWIGFDTEFVSEHTYRSQLCLVQIATRDELVAVDAIALTDLRSLWEVLAAPGHVTVVHAGREELLFSLFTIGRRPQAMFDVQLAAGLVGCEYPAGYANLVSRLLGETPQKGETRSDWRRRPLTERQVAYALEDVRHLQPLHAMLEKRLAGLGRAHWLSVEMQAWQDEVESSLGGERWRRVPKCGSLSSRVQAIVRELWQWREDEAQRRNRPVRQILRDDLLLELAKRRSEDPRQIRALRGMERGDLNRAVPEIAGAIERALGLPDEACPASQRRDTGPQFGLLGQFLTTALAGICREAQVAASLVGTANDVRELIAARLGQNSPNDPPPLLTQGWRAEVVGKVLDELLAGQRSIRVADAASEQPLVIEPSPPHDPS